MATQSLNRALNTRLSSGVGAIATPKNIDLAQKEYAPFESRAKESMAEQALLTTGVTAAKGEEAKAQSALEQRKLDAEETATKEFATTQKGLVDEAKRKEEKDPFPTFQPSQEDAMSYGQLGSMIATLGVMLGSGGKASAKVALGSMSGMMSGWQKGRKDLWEKEAKTFDKEMSRIKAIREGITKDLEMGLKLAATDREASRAALASAAHKAGSGSVINAMINTGRAVDALNLAKSSWNLEKELTEKRMALAERQTAIERAEMIRRQDLAEKAGEKTQKATQQQFIVQRSVNALGGVASALEAIVLLPQGSTTGWLPNLQTKDGMVNAIRNQLGRKISAPDADMMNTLFSGIGRNLASIEASGTATGLTTLANQLQSGVYINAGVDDPYKVAIKLADIRRIASENIRPAIDAGLMPKQQADTAKQLVERIEKIIPYTVVDVVVAYREAKKPKSQTIGESTSKVVQPSTTATAPIIKKEKAKDGEIVHKDKNGDKAVQRNGTWVEVE